MSPRKAPRNQANPHTQTSPSTSVKIEGFIAEIVVEAINTYEANQNNGRERGESSRAPITIKSSPNSCTYQNFLSYKPPIFKGTEGAIGLIHWIEKIETIFQISNCAITDRVKYATCTLQDNALTWWIAISQSRGIDNADLMSWTELKLLMKRNYCPRNEIRELEVEFWIHVTEGLDIISRINQFHELSLLCPSFVTPEYKQLEQYIQGLPFQIQGDVTSSNITIIQTLIRLAHSLVDKIKHQNISNPKLDSHRRKWDNHNHQEKLEAVKVNGGFAGTLPFCGKCHRHHNSGLCNDHINSNKNIQICYRCEQTGHTSTTCQARLPAPIPHGNCFNCGEAGHFRSQCPKRKWTVKINSEENPKE